MDHKRINKLIKKISSLNKSIEEDNEFSSMELEHMLNYIQKLYEVAGGSEMDLSSSNKEKKKAKKVKVEPVIVEAVVEEIIEEETLVPNVQAVKVIEKAPEPVVIEKEPKIAAELLALFEDEGGTDLSDKLASRPIKTLTKAMGINEKIFTVKELFGGNQKEFDNMMVALDGLVSFEEAKSVLVGSVADKYEWASDKKIKKASTFIKLVRRRYN